MKHSTTDSPSNSAPPADHGFSSFSTSSTGTGGSLPAGSRLQTYINMSLQRKSAQNGSSSLFSPILSSSSGGESSSSSKFHQQNGPPASSYNHYGGGVQQQSSFFPPDQHFAANNQQPSRQHQNFTPVNRFGSPPTSTPALPHSISTPSFAPCNIESTSSLDSYQNARSPRETPTPPNAIPVLRHRMSKSPSTIPETPPMVLQEAIGGTTYFFNPDDASGASAVHQQQQQQQQSSSLLPNFYLYSGPPSNVFHSKPRGAGAASFFIPNELKMDLMQRHLLSLAQVDVEQHPDIPQEVDYYNQVVPLDYVPKNQLTDKSRYFNCTTSVYKANSTKDGLAYCLRRVHGFRLSNLRSLGVIDTWKKIQHSNVVQIREVFTTKAFGDYSLVFVYDYYPGAETLKQRHFGGGSPRANGLRPYDDLDAQRNRGGLIKSSTGNRFPNGLMSEPLIWCYIVQLSSALRSIHAVGLAARTMDVSKILIIGQSRLLVNCCGVHDVLTFDHAQQNASALTQNYQQEDLVGLGRIVLALACQNLTSVQREQLQICVEYIHRHYSMDLKNLILYLLAPNRTKNVNDLMPIIGARFYSQIDAAHMRIDLLENELAKELENGRLFRLLSKLGTVNERPEYNMDPHWSETGDRYLLKLFRDYLFHQVTEEGKAWLDMAHVVQCLNKLDAGVPEKIMLTSRDQQNVLVVSYADLRRCLDQAFNELVRPAVSKIINGPVDASGHH